MSFSCFLSFGLSALNSHEQLILGFANGEGWSRSDRLSLGQNDESVSGALHQIEMLLDDENAGANFPDCVERLDQPVDKYGRKSLRGLVEKQEAGVGHQRAADRKHLLLTAA